MDKKPTYEELEQKIKELEDEVAKMRDREKALQKSEKTFSTVINASKDGIIAINRAGEITIFNPAAERMFGHDRKEMIGQQLDCLMPEKFRKKHREYVKEYFAKSKSSGAVNKTRDLFALHKSGYLFPIELSLSSSINDSEQVVIAVIRDITKRKKAEEELRKSKENFEDLFEHASDMIQSIDPNGRFLQVNKKWKEILGYDEGEIPQLNLWDIIHPDYRKHCEEVLQNIMAGATVNEIEVVFVSKKGETIPVEGNVNCRIENGKVLATRGIFRDIRRRKRAEDDLKKAHEQTKEANKKLQLAYTKMRESKDELSMQLQREEIGLMLNEVGQILGITDLVLEITGLNRNEIMKKNILDLIDERSKEKLKKNMKEAFKGISQEISVGFVGEKSDHSAFEGKLMRIGSEKNKSLFLLLRELD